VNQEIRKLEHQVFAHCEIFIAGIEQVSLIAIRNANPAGAGFGRKKNGRPMSPVRKIEFRGARRPLLTPNNLLPLLCRCVLQGRRTLLHQCVR